MRVFTEGGRPGAWGGTGWAGCPLIVLLSISPIHACGAEGPKVPLPSESAAASISVTPDSVSLPPGGTVQLAATRRTRP
ncbi:hypothetical protein [Candidatus Palauibacter sp.]|uniref:hypothetical protein n=1 Tax=Candidatus Palauibacter sp. TaxID=3101350 RepID=UPI003B5C0E0A